MRASTRDHQAERHGKGPSFFKSHPLGIVHRQQHATKDENLGVPSHAGSTGTPAGVRSHGFSKESPMQQHATKEEKGYFWRRYDLEERRR